MTAASGPQTPDGGPLASRGCVGELSRCWTSAVNRVKAPTDHCRICFPSNGEILSSSVLKQVLIATETIQRCSSPAFDDVTPRQRIPGEEIFIRSSYQILAPSHDLAAVLGGLGPIKDFHRDGGTSRNFGAEREFVASEDAGHGLRLRVLGSLGRIT